MRVHLATRDSRCQLSRAVRRGQRHLGAVFGGRAAIVRRFPRSLTAESQIGQGKEKIPFKGTQQRGSKK